MGRLENYLDGLKQGLDTLIVLIMPNSKCNLNCVYCAPYHSPNFVFGGSSKRMSYKTLNHILGLIEDFKDRYPVSRIHVQIHGYEPLLAGKEFFEYVAKRLQKIGLRLATQSNGTLIDDDWARIIRKYKIGIGISIDGPKEIHDKLRIYPSGKGSYNQAIRGFKVLKKHNVEPGMISVITRYHIGKEEEFIKWIEEENIKSIKLNFPAINNDSILPSVKDLISFFEKLYLYWRRSGREIHPFKTFAEALLLKIPSPGSCFLLDACHKILGINYDGRIVLCDRYIVSTKENINNIKRLEDIFKIKEIIQRAEGRVKILKEKDCRGCKYFKICHGGCTYEALALKGTIYTKSYFCQIYKWIFERIEKDLAVLLRD